MLVLILLWFYNIFILTFKLGVESNRTNFELIFLEFFKLKKYFRINRIENFSNRTNRIILPSNRIEFRIFSLVVFRIFSNSFEFFRIFSNNFFSKLQIKRTNVFKVKHFWKTYHLVLFSGEKGPKCNWNSAEDYKLWFKR